jgi:hypothetical protein
MIGEAHDLVRIHLACSRIVDIRTLTSDILVAMQYVRICPDCERLLTTASDAMRRHAEDMHVAISSVQTGLTEDQVDEYKIKLIASFNDAQSAWGAYRAHLREHGILPVIPPSTQI